MGEPMTDPILAAKIREALDQYAENADWFQAHLRDIKEKHPGEYIAVVACRVFADTDRDGLKARVLATDPDGWGSAFKTFVPAQPTA